MQTLIINKDRLFRQPIIFMLMGLLLPFGGCLNTAEDMKKKEEEAIKEFIEN